MPWGLSRRMVIVACREKAAKHYPTDHCRENEPKLGVNTSIDSHVILPWPPLVG
jgi:hypothetical protein